MKRNNFDKAIGKLIEDSERKAKKGGIIRFIFKKISHKVTAIGSWFVALLILLPTKKQKR